MCLASHTERFIVIVIHVTFSPWEGALYSDVSFININVLYTVLAVIELYESVYIQAQATFPTLVVN